MKILAFVNRDSSPAYHRIILPLDGTEENIQITNDLHTSHFDGVQLFLYNRILPEFATMELYRLRKEQGFKIGVDVDDYWLLDNTHPYKTEYIEKQFAKLQINQMVKADFVTVTHERLAKAVKPYNKNVYILPNAIPRKEQFIKVKSVPHPEQLVRVFWQGSNTHLADIAEIRTAIMKLEKLICSYFIEMVLAGYDKDALIWEEIAKLYTDRGKLKHSLLAPLHYEQYYYLYQEADICIAPLRKSLFNSMKSNLKVLEAANLKLPIIVSKVEPYLNLPVIYASTPGEWVKQITALMVSPAKRKEEGEKLHSYCAEHFNFDKINKERQQIYKHYSI